MQAPSDALRWAAAVVSLSPEGPLAAKAWYRVGQALEKQQAYNNARIVYKHAAKVHSSCKEPCGEALKRMTSLRGDEKAPSEKDAHRSVLSQVSQMLKFWHR
jgi:TolA-binding protein